MDEPLDPLDVPLTNVQPVGGDLVQHTLDESCVCGPTVEDLETLDGSASRLIVHHSLDGRELFE